MGTSKKAVPQKEREVLRLLAGQVAEIAALPIQKEKARMWRCLNGLEPQRPMVWVNQIPWHEMGPEVELRTHTEFLRTQERYLRHILYQWKHVSCDMVVEPRVFSPVAFHDSGFGIEAELTSAPGDTGYRDTIMVTGASHFEPVIRKDEDIEKIKTPQVHIDENATEENYELLAGIFGDILSVEKGGIGRFNRMEGQDTRSYFTFSPWDTLVTWLGVEESLIYPATRPEFLHRVIQRFVDAWLSRLDQYEKLGLLTLNSGPWCVGSGGYGYTTELPRGDFDGDHIRPIDMWGFSTAQIFGGVSPEMHEEFSLRYERGWLDRFGLTYYGCCEPLDTKIRILKSIPNLRKISISPWADEGKAATQIGNEYVLSLKPNPAVLASESWNLDAAREDLREKLANTKGCAVEVIMKDISTCRHEPRRIWEWAKMAMEEIEEYT